MGCQEAERKARLLEHPSPGTTPGRGRIVWMGSDTTCTECPRPRITVAQLPGTGPMPSCTGG